MTHAAPKPRKKYPRRWGQVALGAVVYALAALLALCTTLGAVLAVWGLWTILGVN